MGEYQRQPEGCIGFDLMVTDGIIARNILRLA